MKIKIISQGEPIRVFHDAMEVFCNRKEKTLEILNSKTHKIDEKFLVEKRELDWVACTNDADYEEIHAIFYVKQLEEN